MIESLTNRTISNSVLKPQEKNPLIGDFSHLLIYLGAKIRFNMGSLIDELIKVTCLGDRYYKGGVAFTAFMYKYFRKYLGLKMG